MDARNWQKEIFIYVMGKILSPELATTYIDQDPWERDLITRPFFYWSLGELRCMPDGFKSDGSTIPRMALWIIPRYKTRVTGYIHDWEYFIGTKRKKADIRWYEMSQVGWPRLTKTEACLGYNVLKSTGWYAYNGHQSGRLGADMNKITLIRHSEDLIMRFRFDNPEYTL